MPAAPRTLRRCLGLLVVALIAGGAGCRRSHHQVDPTCEDGKRDGQETAIDCGGPTCDPCEEGAACVAARDCQTRVCAADGYCGAAVCGDGVVSPGEACDDGNTTSGDGCSAACAVEEG